MVKKCFAALFIVLNLFVVTPYIYADSSNSFVSVVNPVRGGDFWDTKDQSPIDAVRGQAYILQRLRIPATWLLRFDALEDSATTNFLRSQLNSEYGLFLEITPTWTKAANVHYRESAVWHMAGSIFLTGYEVEDRHKLIDAIFESFREKFGYYPTSVGSWWVDSNSLDYMQKKYHITSAMIVADQYTTDNYQVWGQYWSSPYLPSKNNTLFPAQKTNNKIPVVMTQWAARDPVNGYGGGVHESTYSVQVNDYFDYHDLDEKYFSKLIDIYTLQKFNEVNQVVVGLENSYPWSRFSDGYQKQMQVLADKRSKGQLSLVKSSDFANWYLKTFPEISPTQIIVADDPFGSHNKSVWFMDPYYRAGWFYDSVGASFRDIRPYIEGQQEQCFDKACESIKATNYITRVLDNVATGSRLILDKGRIHDFNFEKNGDDYKLSYKNEAGAIRQVVLKPRDITIDETTRTIDLTIAYAQSQSENQKNSNEFTNAKLIQGRFLDLGLQFLKFVAFVILGFFVPGYLLIRELSTSRFGIKIFISIVLGFVNLTIVSFIAGLLKMDILVWVYLGTCFGLFVIKKYWVELFENINLNLCSYSILVMTIIFMGVVFQTLMLLKSGLLYSFGMGFWGPLGHDGIWHQALINQLIKNIPPQNPGFAGSNLRNYHYFYDLLVAQSFKLTQIPIVDLIYRLYPILFSIFIGIGTYLLSDKLFKNRFVSVLCLYLVYFAGSFGWVIEFLREGHLGGESAFWVNQPVSMNLNPPFAVSLVIIIAILLLISYLLEQRKIILIFSFVVLMGSLVEFKVYAAIILFICLGILGVIQLLKKQDSFLIKILFSSGLLSAVVFLPQNSGSQDLLTFYPFWFVHSMVDYPDRVGWLKLSQARLAYQERGEWLKYLITEGIGLGMFILGNLGMRFFGLWEILKVKKASEVYKVMILISIVSMVIPIFLIQKGNPWNTIQFFYYGLFIVSIFAAATLYRIYKKLPKLIGILMIVFVLIVLPINAITTFRSGLYDNPPSRLSFEELDALSFLRAQPDGVVLTQPYNKDTKGNFKSPFRLFMYETTSYVSAFSTKASFLEDEIQQDILQEDFKKRVVSADNFFLRRDYSWSKQFLKDNQIAYIYFLKNNSSDFNPDKLGLEKIFENAEVQIFKVK